MYKYFESDGWNTVEVTYTYSHLTCSQDGIKDFCFQQLKNRIYVLNGLKGEDELNSFKITHTHI